MTKKQQVHDLIRNLRERSHVVEFAEKCAERAQGYAATTSDAALYALYALYASYAAAATTTSAAAYAAAEAAYVAANTATSATSATERDLQIKHLKELHARETSQGE